MAQTKATSDALMAMAEQLRQSAEQIQAAKASMNTQLHSFSWDDPVGIAFINDYHEKMKPIDNKLLPALEVYSVHLERLVGGIEEYNGGSAIHITGTENIARVLPKGSAVDPITLNENAKVNIPHTTPQRVSSDDSLAAGIGIVGVAGFAATAKMATASTQSSDGVVKSRVLPNLTEEEQERLKKDKVISLDDDPMNVDLSEKDYEELRKNPTYSKLYNAYLDELKSRKPDFRKGISAKDIDEINSSVSNLKEDELTVSFQHLGQPDQLGGECTGRDAVINDDFLIKHPQYSRCGVGAMGAHESAHARQYKIYSIIYDKKQQGEVLTPSEESILNTYPETYKVWSEKYHNSAEERNARTYQYAFRDACNTYAMETLYPELKTKP